MKHLVIILIVLGTLSISSCKKEDLFEQPSIEVTGYTLVELPSEYTYLEIEMIVTNNDSREAHISDVTYQVLIEGISSEQEEVDINQDIPVDSPLELTLPLTLVTKDAIQLLTKLDAGEELSYIVTGMFHVDDPILNRFDFPIDIQGTASVDVGFEDFYKQPEVTVINISGTSSISGFTSYIFDFDADCTVQNMDARSVIIDEVEYFVYIEGVKSETHLYSDSYSTDITIAGGETLSLTLPVKLILDLSQGATLASAILDGTVNYTIEGTFHAIKVDEETSNFILPFYDSGSIPASMVSL